MRVPLVACYRMPKPRARKLFAAMGMWLPLCITSPRAAWAHDQWLVPTVLASPDPVSVQVSLYVGEDLVADEEKAMDPTRVASAMLRHGARERDIRATAIEGARPCFDLGTLDEGMYLISVERAPIRIELPPAKFESYLHEEGLTAIVDERARRGETASPGRERYRRSLKALSVLGGIHDDTFLKDGGGELELVTLDDPTRSSGGKLRVQARFRSRPLAGLLVEVVGRDGDVIARTNDRTNSEGEVMLTVPAGEIYMLHAVHMQRCEADCGDVDWESFWASYVFGVNRSGKATVFPPVMLHADVRRESDRRRRFEWLGIALLSLVSLEGMMFLYRRRAAANVKA